MASDRPGKYGRHRLDAQEALVVGGLAGIAYFLVGLVLFFPSEEIRLITSRAVEVNLFVYSLALSVVGFASLSLVVLAFTRPIPGSDDSWKRPLTRRFTLYFAIIAVFAAGHALWAHYDRSMPFKPRDIAVEDLTDMLLRLMLVAALSALALSAFVTAIRGRRAPGWAPTTKPLAAALGVCVAYVVIANLVAGASRLSEAHRLERTDRAGPIVLLGIDSASWNVMLPFIERGELPAFERMMSRGSCGYLDTHGAAVTWPSWACIATGKATAKNGIKIPSQLSSDWRAAPVWSILSQAGRNVGVINWQNSWPPFKVNGIAIADAYRSRSGRVYCSPGFASFKRLADSLAVISEGSAFAEEGVQAPTEDLEIIYLSGIHEKVISHCDMDFVTYYYYRVDGVQHLAFEDADSEPRGPRSHRDGQLGRPLPDPILEAYRSADRLLAALMARYGDGAYYLVVSDHGARQVRTRIAEFDMDRLLQEMGFLRMVDGSVDTLGSVCLRSKDASPLDRFDLVVEVTRSAGSVRTAATAGQETVRLIADQLRGIRVAETG